MGRRRGWHWSTEAERVEIRRRVASGERIDDVAAGVGRSRRYVQTTVSPFGGIQPRPVRRSALRLSNAEREEISRGLRAGETLRLIARQLGRAPSTVSREVGANGGRQRYRAVRAEARASRTARRPRAAKLARNRRLRAAVERLLLDLLVAPADRLAAASRSSRRSGDVGVARDDLSVAVRAGPGRPAGRAPSLPADRAGPPSTGRPGHVLRSHQGHGPPQRATGRDRGPGGARPLGRRPDHRQGHPLGDRHPGRTPDPLRAALQAARRADRRGGQDRPHEHHPAAARGTPPERSPGIAARRCTSTSGSPSTPASSSTSAIPTAPGSGAATRTPTASSGSTFPRAPTCPSIARPNSTPSHVNSTADLDKRSAG